MYDTVTPSTVCCWKLIQQPRFNCSNTFHLCNFHKNLWSYFCSPFSMPNKLWLFVNSLICTVWTMIVTNQVVNSFLILIQNSKFERKKNVQGEILILHKILKFCFRKIRLISRESRKTLKILVSRIFLSQELRIPSKFVRFVVKFAISIKFHKIRNKIP